MYKVIVADDEALMLEGWKTIIDWNKFGYELCGAASDGDEALELVKRFEPDLLLTDIRMPGLSGLDLIRELRELNNMNVKSIIVSGYAEFDYARQALRFGVDRYVLKPIVPEEIHELLVELKTPLKSGVDARRSASELQSAAVQACLSGLLRGEPNAIFEAEQLLGPDPAQSLSVLLAEPMREDRQEDARSAKVILERTAERLHAKGIKAWIFDDAQNRTGLLAVCSSQTLSGACGHSEAKKSGIAVYVGRSVNGYAAIPLSYGQAMAARDEARFSGSQFTGGYTESLLKLRRSSEAEQVAGSLEAAVEVSRHPLQTAIAYMKVHYRDKLQLRELADRLHMNPVHLGQAFKREMSCCFNDYIHRLRAEEAQRLLRRTDMKIAEIAERLGYHDTEYFSAKFKAATGELPSAYRMREQVTVS
ncbi:response regulator [Saccharibacillus sacchari]|uniref:Response regulator n=1 Tax=Saccharibacillus sacchari TaxID=456493 RepID=A0ACC6PE76_9BACL